MVQIEDEYYSDSRIFRSKDSLGISRSCCVEYTVHVENINGKAHVKSKWWDVYDNFEIVEEFGRRFIQGIGKPKYYDTASKASRRIACILKTDENYTSLLRGYVDSAICCYQNMIDIALMKEIINNFTKDMQELLDKYNAHLHVEHCHGYDEDSWNEVSVKFENWGEESIVDIAENIRATVVLD